VDPRYASNLIPPPALALPELSEQDQAALASAIQSVMREIDERDVKKESGGEGGGSSKKDSHSEMKQSAISPLIPDWAPGPREQKPSSAEVEAERADFKETEESPLEQQPLLEEEAVEQEIIEEDYSREQLLGGRWSPFPSAPLGCLID
jgi:hypothetical protein